jgi:LuxR family maltose regulon positive regulatory protein
MPFIELGRHLTPLIKAAGKRAQCGIPLKWMKKIDRKASIYIKKADVVLNMFKREKDLDDTIPLSDREQAVLNDLYHGLSRDEIADNQYLSINTVKKILQSIYIKLKENNNVHAVRKKKKKKLV